MEKHPVHDWEYSQEIEDAFVNWFNDLYGPYSLRSEWFYGDCEVKDEEELKRIMNMWVHAAFVAGYEQGFWEATIND